MRVRVLRLSSSVNEEVIHDALVSFFPIQPHDTALIKPNLLRESHILRSDEWTQVITQPEVIRPVAEWLIKDRGVRSLLIADAPEGSADFGLTCERAGVSAVQAAWRGVADIRVEDLRLTRYVQRDGVPIERVALPGDSAGTIRVALNELSAFYGLTTRKYYGADYDIEETNRHHHGACHEYLFSGSAISSPLVVNLPKMKSHKKAGVTLNLKNLVGLNGNKNWLPHHTIGTPSRGGDAYANDMAAARLESAILNRLKPLVRRSRMASVGFRHLKRSGARVFGDTQESIRSGNWFGNDTVWRMILDLNRILMYARADGSLARSPQRTLLSVVDGLIAGEGNGPEAPDAVPCNIVVMGDNFLAVDLVCTRLMGFDYRRIPHLRYALDPHPLALGDFAYEDIIVESDYSPWSKPLHKIALSDCFRFRPHFGWAGQIELTR